MRYGDQRLVDFLRHFLSGKASSPDDGGSETSSCMNSLPSSYMTSTEDFSSSCIAAVNLLYLSRVMLVSLVVELSEKTL